MPTNQMRFITAEEKEILTYHISETNKLLARRLGVSQYKISSWKKELGLVNKNIGRPSVSNRPIKEGMFEHLDDWFAAYKD